MFALCVARIEKIFAARKVHALVDVTDLLDLARGIEGDRREAEIIDKTGSKKTGKAGRDEAT